MVQDLFPASITQLPVAGLGDAAWHINLSHAGLKADWVWSVDGHVWLIPGQIPAQPSSHEQTDGGGQISRPRVQVEKQILLETDWYGSTISHAHSALGKSQCIWRGKLQGTQ